MAEIFAHFEGESDILTVPADFFFFEASISQERPEFDHADLAADVQVAHFIDSHIRVKIDAAFSPNKVYGSRAREPVDTTS